MTRPSQNPVSVLVHAEYESLYDQVVQPDHIIGVPHYFVRHIPLLGADLAWMYLAFRQAAYEVGLRKYGATGRFSGRQIAAWSGIVPRTFWNRAARPETWQKLEGLVRPLRAEDASWQEDKEALLREPNQYAVSMTLPLTALDAASLRTWLLQAADKQNPDLALMLAADTPGNELFSLPSETGFTKTVFAVVEELFGSEIPAPRLVKLGTQLHRHIMGSRLEITHFFARNVLPFLGTGPGMMVVLLRDHAGDKRQAVVDGGYAEIAGWLGLKDPETVWSWFNAKVTETRQMSRKESNGKPRTGGRAASPVGTLRNPILPLYAREVPLGRADQNFASAPRKFQILQEEIPLEMLDFPTDINLERLENWLVAQELFLRFAHPIPAVCTPLFLRFAHLVPVVCTVLNIQLPPPHSFVDTKEKNAADAEPISPYPASLNEAMAHPDIRFYQAMTGCYPEPKDWALTIDYVTQLRRRSPDLGEAELASAGESYFAEWASRNYQHTNPSWMHWWLSGYIPPRKARRTRQSKQPQTPKTAPVSVQVEPEPEIDVEDNLRQLEASRRYLESRGFLKPRAN